MALNLPPSVLAESRDYLKLFPFISGRYLLVILDDKGNMFFDEKTMLSSSLEKATRVLAAAKNIRELFEVDVAIRHTDDGVPYLLPQTMQPVTPNIRR